MNNDIDFLDASKEWNQNKIKHKKGYYQYKCKLCDEPIYWYTVQNKYFKTFATKFDLENQHNPRQHLYCEEHLMNDS
jgi:hypothetical protein